MDGDKQDETGRGAGEDDSDLGIRDERSDEAESMRCKDGHLEEGGSRIRLVCRFPLLHLLHILSLP